MLSQCHKHDAAEAAYRKALAISPDLPEAHHGLATVMDAGRRPDAAIQSYEHALKLAPNCLFKHVGGDSRNSGTDRLAWERLPNYSCVIDQWPKMRFLNSLKTME